MGFLLWREAFRYFNLGDASAIGWILFLIVLIVTLVQWRCPRCSQDRRAYFEDTASKAA